MRRVLWVLNGCGLEGRGVTGAPVRFHEISRRFAERGVAQHVMTTSGGVALLRGLGCALPMTVVPASLFLRREPCVPFRLWSYVVSAIGWRLRARALPAFDTVITVSDYFCDVVPALALRKKTGAKWIAWVHHCETAPSQRPGNRLANEVTYRIQNWSFGRIARSADSAWINDTLAGDEIEARLKARGMAAGRIRRMWNGVDLGAIGAAKGEAKFDAVMVGVRPNKGLHDIIPIWRRVNELRPGTTLMLMGGMSGETETLAEIARLRLPITVFRPEGGLLPAGEYYAKLKEARVMFAPSHEEGWGIAVCEAMGAGLPVVAYDLAAYRKIYAGAYEGVECFDHESFARKLVAVLEGGERFAALKAAGLGAAGKYDWAAIAERDLAALEA